MKRAMWAFSVLIIACLLISCVPRDTPEQGAREWIDAIVNQDGNRVLKHTCLAQRENVQEASMWFSAFAVLGQLFTNRSVQIEGDVSDLKFETTSRDGDRAEVRVYGELRVAVLGAAQAQQVDERWQMVRENDTWRWCGSSADTLPLARTSAVAQATFSPTATPLPTFVLPTPVPATSNTASRPPLDGQIAFTASDVAGNYDVIYVINADGSGLRRLTDESSRNSVPAWSPDGQQIAFASDRDGNFEVYVMNADGSNQTRLTNNPAVDANPSWSPDGQQIALVSDRDGNFEVYVMNADGSNQTRLTNNPADDGSRGLAWSPNGQWIAFISRRDALRSVYIINADGSGERKLSDGASGSYTDPLTWSPDGQHIAFSANHCIYAVNAADGGDKRVLVSGDQDISYEQPSWSPDGQQVAAASLRAAPYEIYIIDLDGGGERQLTIQELIGRHKVVPVWSPR